MLLTKSHCLWLLWLAAVSMACVQAGEAPRLTAVRVGDEFVARTFAHDGGKLSCVLRAGDGPTLVLIPGTFSDHRAFAFAAPHLDPSLNLVIIENRGLGGSWPPPEHGSIEQCAQDALFILDSLGIKSFFVGGHSLGGMIAKELGRAHPERVQGVISLEGWTNAQAAKDAFDNDMRSTLSADQLQFLADYRKDVTSHWTPEQMSDFATAWKRWDGRDFLEATKLPILEIYGDRAKPRPDRSKLAIPDRPNIRLLWLEGASHSLLVERPQEVADAINEFVLAQTRSTPPASNEEGDDFDVVVIGGTPGGIAAAVTAARLGRSVALVEYHPHLGGMSAGGLSSSDILHREMIQGIFREFVDRVLAHYTTRYGADSPQVKASHDGYKFEPSVAERVFDELVAEQPSITVWKNHELQQAVTEDGRVVSVTVKDRESGRSRVLNAKVFIDGTYEGDLYAAAGAEFRTGRESRDEFGEPHAGHIYCDVPTQEIVGGTGEGDDRIQAYTYRVCVTTNPANQVPLTAPPAGYDRTRYLGYLDDAKSGRFGKRTLAEIAFTFRPLPNDKFDLNMKPSPLGYVFVEENTGYPTADWTERERIAQHIRDITLGLLWFLQHDEAVPPESREFAQRYHLCKDEFADNGHFPFQLYVREARRLVGEYVLTERNTTEQAGVDSERLHPDSIAVGEHPIDSMPMRKRQPGDTVVLEGYLCMLSKITRPYQIPYRIMLPKTLNGVLVPVAASASHIGFSTIRLEPTWMALGQAAGAAAHLAVEHSVEPRDVPYHELRSVLISQGAVLDLPQSAGE